VHLRRESGLIARGVLVADKGHGRNCITGSGLGRYECYEYALLLAFDGMSIMNCHPKHLPPDMCSLNLVYCAKADMIMAYNCLHTDS
jgi:hypothetical protein